MEAGGCKCGACRSSEWSRGGVQRLGARSISSSSSSGRKPCMRPRRHTYMHHLQAMRAAATAVRAVGVSVLTPGVGVEEEEEEETVEEEEEEETCRKCWRGGG